MYLIKYITRRSYNTVGSHQVEWTTCMSRYSLPWRVNKEFELRAIKFKNTLPEINCAVLSESGWGPGAHSGVSPAQVASLRCCLVSPAVSSYSFMRLYLYVWAVCIRRLERTFFFPSNKFTFRKCLSQNWEPEVSLAGRLTSQQTLYGPIKHFSSHANPLMRTRGASN